MPSSNRPRAAAVCALALVLVLSLSAQALAAGTSATLRVVGKGNKVLTEQTLKTGTISIKSSPKAKCFGAGNVGSGASTKVPGATAFGLLAQAAATTSSLRPLVVSDAFSFGLALCGVGQSTAHGEASWYLKVNHRGAQVSGDAVKLHAGDEVLWDLAPKYPYPNELALEAPKAADPGVPFTVRVVSYDEKGKKKPVKGVTVPGAAAPTAGDGSATVTLMGPTTLRVKNGTEIPSAGVPVCVGGTCPSGS